nr:MAG TPA: Protein of unknown function (DUF4223) [Caudoviricetes sp.]
MRYIFKISGKGLIFESADYFLHPTFSLYRLFSKYQ